MLFFAHMSAERRENRMFLVIGEKPGVEQVLAKVLGAEKKEEGYGKGGTGQ